MKLHKKLIPTEHQEQSNVISWAKTQINVYPALINLYAVPNASKCSFGAAKYRNAEGLKSGVPDLVLAVQNKDYGSLYIEMKRSDRKNEKDGGSSENQIKWRKNLNTFGMLSIVCYGFDEAREAILAYLANRQQHECVLLGKQIKRINDESICVDSIL